MLKTYPQFKKGEVENVYKIISNTEKKILEDYLTYRKARGLHSDDKVNDVRRYILHLRHILQKEFKKITLGEYREILAIVNSSRLSNNAKNHVKIDFRNFLKYLFPDWSMRFRDFDDIRLDSQRNEEKINSNTIFTEKEIQTLLEHEQNLFWKTLLMIQYEGGLRTIEVRTIKWEDIKFNVEGDISEIKIFSTKTKHYRIVFVKDSTFFLKKLKEQQENDNDKGVYVFHLKTDKDKPINKNNISVWFRRLCKKALGRTGWNYLLRHSRATSLYRLAEENKISKDSAIRFMGHSKDMSKTYIHFDKKDIKKILGQVYKSNELPPEKKKELELKIEKLEEDLKEIKENRDSFAQSFVKLLNKVNSMEKKIKVKKS